MVEIEKEKASKKLERQTTAMFPSRNEAPTEKTFIQVRKWMIIISVFFLKICFVPGNFHANLSSKLKLHISINKGFILKYGILH